MLQIIPLKSTEVLDNLKGRPFTICRQLYEKKTPLFVIGRDVSISMPYRVEMSLIIADVYIGISIYESLPIGLSRGRPSRQQAFYTKGLNQANRRYGDKLFAYGWSKQGELKKFLLAERESTCTIWKINHRCRPYIQFICTRVSKYAFSKRIQPHQYKNSIIIFKVSKENIQRDWRPENTPTQNAGCAVANQSQGIQRNCQECVLTHLLTGIPSIKRRSQDSLLTIGS